MTADNSIVKKPGKSDVEYFVPRQNDNWGANQYLNNDKLKFVHDYLSRTDQLLIMSDSIKHVPCSCDYETVSSLDQLFKEPEEQNDARKIATANVSNSWDHAPSSESSLLTEEKDQPAPLINNYMTSSFKIGSSVTEQVAQSREDIKEELRTHRPSTGLNQFPVFSTDIYKTLSEETTSPKGVKITMKATDIHKPPPMLKSETTTNSTRAVPEKYKAIKRMFLTNEYEFAEKSNAIVAAAEPEHNPIPSKTIGCNEKHLPQKSDETHAKESRVNGFLPTTSFDEEVVIDKTSRLKQDHGDDHTEKKSKSTNSQRFVVEEKEHFIPKLNLSDVNNNNELVLQTESIGIEPTHALKEAPLITKGQSRIHKKLNKPINDKSNTTPPKKKPLPKVHLFEDTPPTQYQKNSIRPSSASKFNRTNKSASPPRKWEKSSIAWSSYGKGQLKTWSSIKTPTKKSPLEKQNGDFKQLLIRPTKDFFTTIENYWTCLPEEVVVHIFGFLSVPDLLNVGSVCKTFYRIANDFHLWKAVKVSDVEVSDDWFIAMGNRNPESLSLLRCNGSSVTNVGLRTFFKNCKTSLTDLHVEKCSGSQLTGDSILLHASCHCRNLKDVNVAWSKTTDNGLIAIALALPTLQGLNINGNSAVSEEAFEILTQKHGIHLKSLEMSGCFSISGDVLSSLVLLTTSLHTLNIGLCSKITSECIINMCSNSKSLKHLDLRGVKSVTNQCLHAIAIHCEQLQTLIISNCPFVSDVGIAEIATHRSLLTHLDISGCSLVTDQGVTSFLMVANAIEHLDLSSTGATHISVDFIVHNNLTLKTLKLSFCHNITSSCLSDLLKVSVNLKSLHLYGCKRIKLSQLMKISKSVLIEK